MFNVTTIHKLFAATFADISFVTTPPSSPGKKLKSQIIDSAELENELSLF